MLTSSSPDVAVLERDHLFISYAWEDGALAEWLARKLTAAGYRVWIDRFKMLGGERWPKDIDRAIKTRTFRMIALLSAARRDHRSAPWRRTLDTGTACRRPR